MGESNAAKQIDEFSHGFCKSYADGERLVVCDYLYQLFMQKSTSDTALMSIFYEGCISKLPLGTSDRLGKMNPEMPVSYVYGDDDWAAHADERFSKKITHENGKYIICPTSTHQLAMDNPEALSKIMINTFLDMDLPVLARDKY
jgi:pimeloyl-ACP methyl ester carboxylesterase